MLKVYLEQVIIRCVYSALIGAAENYYKNNKTPDGKTGDIVGFLAGAKVGGDFAGKALNRPVTYIYKSPILVQYQLMEQQMENNYFQNIKQ